MSKCSVYVLTNPSLKEVKSLVLDDHGLNVSPVKIGVAKDMPSRLGPLNTPMTENFVVHVQVDLESKESAHFLEKVLHETLDQYRLKTSDGYPTASVSISCRQRSAIPRTPIRDRSISRSRASCSPTFGRSRGSEFGDMTGSHF